jgi:branched-chain amino acid transport system substrate-binding protein
MKVKTIRTLRVSLLGGVAAALFATSAAAQVKIGVLGDMSGAYADLGGKGSAIAARMAIEDFGGQVLGKPIELVSADHQNKTDVAASIARRWYDREGVTMITDLTNSAVAIAVQGISREKKKINLVTSTATTALTNKECSPWGVHWTFDAYALANAPVRAMIESGAKKWFFITADYTFGHNLQETTEKMIKKLGGTVVGTATHPFTSQDFSSQLLKAQASGADIVALANSGSDTSNSVKQANEFGIQKKQKIVSLLTFITDVHSMGLPIAQGLSFSEAFYWDQNDETRAWSQKFMKRHGTMPSMVHAGTYSAVAHYLKAVKAANSIDADAVMAKMREIPVNDFAFKNGTIRPDGVHDHDMYLFQVKTPKESKRPWDYYKQVAVIPKGKTFQPLEEVDCPLLKKG